MVVNHAHRCRDLLNLQLAISQVEPPCLSSDPDFLFGLKISIKWVVVCKYNHIKFSQDEGTTELIMLFIVQVANWQ